MPKRQRNLLLYIMANHDELAIIQERMKKLGSQNRSIFLGKMAVEGYAVNVDLAPAKGLISLQWRCENNLAQIFKYAQAHSAYQCKRLCRAIWRFSLACLAWQKIRADRIINVIWGSWHICNYPFDFLGE